MFTAKHIKENIHLIANASELDSALTLCVKAQKLYSVYSQAKVDNICEYVVETIAKNKDFLSDVEIKETGIGRYSDKVSKVLFSSKLSWEYMRVMKTCGVINQENDDSRIEIACPIGVIAAYAPITNPVPTAIYKALSCLKTRNAMILSPHVNAQECSLQTVALIEKAAVEAGAPKGLFAMVYKPTEKLTRPVMVHKDVGLVWATGGKGLVRHAYSSGKPCYGVGCANVPVILHSTCDIAEAVNNIYISKVYDNGVLCASEEVVIVPTVIFEDVKKMIQDHEKLTFLTREEGESVRKLLSVNGRHINPEIIGQDSAKIAAMAGLKWRDERISKGEVLVHEVSKEDFKKENFWLREKLSPCLALYEVSDDIEAAETAKIILSGDGEGHSAIVHVNYNQSIGRDFVLYCSGTLDVSRVTVNQPGVLGTPGGPTSHNNMPSVSLGCGSWGGNSTTDNVGPLHLINKKRVNCMDKNINIVTRSVSDVKVVVRCAIEMFIELIERVAMVIRMGKFPSSSLRKCLSGTYHFLVSMSGLPLYENTTKQGFDDGNDLFTMATMTSVRSFFNKSASFSMECESSSAFENVVNSPEAEFLEAIDIYMAHGYGKKVSKSLRIVDEVLKRTAIPRSQIMIEMFDTIISNMDIPSLLKRQKGAFECIGLTRRLDAVQWGDYIKEVFCNLDSPKTNFAVTKELNMYQKRRYDATMIRLCSKV